MGVGQHRILYLKNGKSIKIVGRRIFRERHELILELFFDSLVHHAGHQKFLTQKISDGANIDLLLTGDRIRMVNQEGDDIYALFLPWISLEDRRDIAQKLQCFFDESRPHEKVARPRTSTNDILLNIGKEKNSKGE